MKSKYILIIAFCAILLLVSCTPEEPKTTQDIPVNDQIDNTIEETSDHSDNAIYINNQKLSSDQIQELTTLYGAAPVPGNYWYDPLSGSYGIWHGASLGLILPGHDFGNVPEDASAGDTD